MGEENPEQGYQAAQVLFQQQRYAESLALLDRLLNSHPGAPELHYARALCLSRLGRLGEAVQTCDRLIRDFRHENAQRLKVQILTRQASPHAPVARVQEPGRYAQPGKARGKPVLLGAVALAAAVVLMGLGMLLGRGTTGPEERRARDAATLPPPSPATTAPPLHRGFALLASSVGSTYHVEDVAAFAEQGGFALVIVDWAWITHHWEQTRFDELQTLVAALHAKGIRTAAMYRPRFLSDPTVPTQTKADGSNAFSHGYQINYFDPAARQWGIEWGTRILRQCPVFDELIIYNPLNLDDSPAAREQLARNPHARDDAIWTFMEEARAAWQAVRPGIQTGVVAMPSPEFWERGSNCFDSAYPFFVLRDHTPIEEELRNFRVMRTSMGDTLKAVLAKVTWESGERVSPERLRDFQAAAQTENIPHVFWTLETLADPARYSPRETAEALAVDEDRLAALFATAPPAPAVTVTRAQVDELFNTIDKFDTNEQKAENIKRLADLAKSADPEMAEYLLQQGQDIVLDTSRGINQRWMICYVLSDSGDERTVPVLNRVLREDPSPLVRGVAACALGSFSSPEALAALEQAPLAERDPGVLREIARSRERQEQLRTHAGGPATSAPPPATHEPALTLPFDEARAEKLPWPHQSPDMQPADAERLARDVWVINDFPIFQGDQEGRNCYFHAAFDVVLPNGTPIYAVKDGWVKAIRHSTVYIADARDGAPCYGWEYTHLGNFQVREGEFIKRGACVGEVQFEGLEHIHLANVFSEGPYWGAWHYYCAPNAHFACTDTEPPVIASVHFFKNNTDEAFPIDASGLVTVTGDVDIVAAIRDPGEMARSRENGFGDRLGVDRLDYAIHRAEDTDALVRRRSFEFSRLYIKKAYDNPEFNTRQTALVFKHWALFEGHRARYDKTLSYYIITNCAGDKPPQTVNTVDGNHCWRTGARNTEGVPLFPDGEYAISIEATDFAGNRAEQTFRVNVRNP